MNSLEEYLKEVEVRAEISSDPYAWNTWLIVRRYREALEYFTRQEIYQGPLQGDRPRVLIGGHAVATDALNFDPRKELQNPAATPR